MNKHAIYHIPDVPYAYPLNKNTLRVGIKVAKKDIKNIEIFYRCRYEYKTKYRSESMNLFEEDNLFEIYFADIKVPKNRYRYFFKIEDLKGDIFYYDERGCKKDIEDFEEDLIPFQYAYIGEADIYKEEKWLQESIVYQIFPERFLNGDKNNDPRGTMPWGGEVKSTSFFGGDIRGIIEGLNYLEELGINLIYLTPIFKSPSNHKYNITNYYKIDENFGTLEDFKELVNKAHEKGMKIILDGVFNHTGDKFFAFQDILKNGENSKYKDWYHIDSFPVSLEEVNYYTFGDLIKYMPKLNTKNKEVKEYFINVTKYWIKETDIDGWRLDVCDEVDHQFWREMKIGIKEVKEDAVLIGEIMHEGVSFLRGEQLDSIMNYPFKHAMVDFFAKGKINSKELNDILSINRYVYMESITKQLWNLFGSHDTHRFLTECNNDLDKMKLAIAFQFTYLGVPYIYYGDEVGIDGGYDPLCRRCMLWNKEEQNLELLNHYKKLITIRKENPSLIHGKYKCIHEEGRVIVFKRTLNGEEIIIAINNSNKKEELNLNLEGIFEELYSGENINVNNSIILDSMSFKMLKKK